MKKLIFIIILFFVSMIAFGLDYSQEEVKKIEDKINNSQKLSEIELVKYILYLQDELVKVHKEKQDLIDNIVKEKEDKIKILEDKIKVLEEQQKTVNDLINQKDIVIKDKEIKIAELEEKKKEVNKTTSVRSYSPFNLFIGVEGGYDFLQNRPMTEIYLKPQFNIFNNLSFYLKVNCETNYTGIGFSFFGCIEYRLF